MIPLATIYERLDSATLKICSLNDLDYFIRLCTHFTPEIQLHTPHQSTKPPYRLPQYLHDFFVSAISLDGIIISKLWDAFKDIIWSNHSVDHCDSTSESHYLTDQEKKNIDLIGKKNSLRKEEKLASIMFYPPISACLRCSRALKATSRIERIPITLFTTDGKGGLDAREGLSTSLKCIGCNVRYYHNYYVADKNRNFYNSNVPAVIQLEDHAYIQSELCELFTSFMLFAWVSSQNCANILNASVKRLNKSDPTLGIGKDLNISSEQVFRAFVLNGLLRDCSERGSPLILPDLGDHDDRLKCAMELRNQRMISEGQPHKMHACMKCEKVIEGPGYQNLRPLRASVTDGVTLGRPCCKVHNCTTPLPNNRAHFCVYHEKLKSVCVVAKCTEPAQSGYQTCSKAEHRAMEQTRKERGKAFFQLKKRLTAQFGSTQLPDSFNPKDSESNIPEMEEIPADTSRKSDEGNRPPAAQFSRRRTHNEQLLVSCCGVVLARGTMFGAESIEGVKDFLKSVFPSKEDLSDVLFYDNSCNLQEHLDAQNDNFFRNIILPVDVFHFKSKHSTAHAYCQRHCNPAMWKELYDEDGNWVFNSSAAEQVNAWIGGYLAIVRDMLAHRYDFFLDEMIKRRNELVLSRLTDDGQCPYHVPLHSVAPAFK